MMDNSVAYSEAIVGCNNDMQQFRAPIPFSNVYVPTMIAHGTCDSRIPISQAEQAANGIPNAILRKVEGASHLIVFHKDGHQLRKE